jgi:hypothetical protein
MERRFLMNWPGIGPSLPGQTVTRDILTLTALQKAKASLETSKLIAMLGGSENLLTTYRG